MPSSPITTIVEHFSEVEDPRAAHRITHQLIEIIAITLCAVICGAESWIEIAAYGRAKEEWLQQWLSLEGGIPSHDTFENVFARLKPEALQQSFFNWVNAICQCGEGRLIALDGKTLRAAYERDGQRSMIHMISAWASQNRMVLAQRKVDEKSNEITAMPELLQALELEGALVSIDAMGCQRNIAATIIKQGGDYVLALKGNQGDLHTDVVQLFEHAQRTDFRGIEHDCYQKSEKGHGRIEQRTYWTMTNTDSGLTQQTS